MWRDVGWRRQHSLPRPLQYVGDRGRALKRSIVLHQLALFNCDNPQCARGDRIRRPVGRVILFIVAVCARAAPFTPNNALQRTTPADRGARDVVASAVVAAATDSLVHAAAAPLLRLHLGVAVRRLR